MLFRQKWETAKSKGAETSILMAIIAKAMCALCTGSWMKSGLLILLILISNTFRFVGLPHSILLQMMTTGTHLPADAVMHRPHIVS